jgi:hypothetical protein
MRCDWQNIYAWLLGNQISEAARLLNAAADILYVYYIKA